MNVELDPKPPRSIARWTEHPDVFACLALPWGEAISSGHDETPGVSFSRGEIHQPPPEVLNRLPVTFDHDGADAGVILATATDRVGIWAAVRFGRKAQRLIASGASAVSPEFTTRGPSPSGTGSPAHPARHR